MPVGIIILITAVAAGGLGLLIGWLWGRAHTPPAVPADSRLEDELRQQLDHRNTELTLMRGQFAQTQTGLAAAVANQAAAEHLLAEQKQRHEQTLADARAAQEKALTDLRDTFRALSAEALKQSAPEFLRLAEQSFGRFQEGGQRRSCPTAGGNQNPRRTLKTATGNLPKESAAKRERPVRDAWAK